MVLGGLLEGKLLRVGVGAGVGLEWILNAWLVTDEGKGLGVSSEAVGGGVAGEMKG